MVDEHLKLRWVVWLITFSCRCNKASAPTSLWFFVEIDWLCSSCAMLEPARQGRHEETSSGTSRKLVKMRRCAVVAGSVKVSVERYCTIADFTEGAANLMTPVIPEAVQGDGISRR
ncbi:hypothetical protein AC1031_005262 [Aphanomyces cochlioides]|nr:hypothetical protein AC1031_005262 [Aphanomyces cochlioides]